MTDLPYYAVTGGPGAGKTTLLDTLAAAGHAVMPEAGRAVIRDQQAIDGPALPWRDPAAFAEQMLGFDLRSHREAAALPGPVFFDRGLPDIVGYLRLTGLPVPDHLMRAAATLRYRAVFLAPFWPEIYTRDTERRQDRAEAERTCEAVAAAWRSFGYVPVPLPRAPVPERRAFVLSQLDAARHGIAPRRSRHFAE